MNDTRERVFAYKGFDKNFKCRNTQYSIDKTAFKDNGKDVLGSFSFPANKIKTRSDFNFPGPSYSNHGLYSAQTFADIPSEYRVKDGIIAKVEILGNYIERNGQYESEAIKVLEVLSKDDIKKILREQEIEKYKESLNLDIVQILQDHFTSMHLGGSTALYLHGCNVTVREKSDIDIVLPYFQHFPEIEGFTLNTVNIKNSGNDFDYGVDYSKDGRYIKVDVKIDPRQHYTRKEVEGYTYNLSPVFTIMEAKLRYAMMGSEKHQKDITNMVKFSEQVLHIDVDKEYNRYFDLDSDLPF